MDKKYTWWLRKLEEDLKCGTSRCRAQASGAHSSSELRFPRLHRWEAKQATQPVLTSFLYHRVCLFHVESGAQHLLLWKGVIVSKKMSEDVLQTVSWNSGDSGATLWIGVVTYLCQSRRPFKTQILCCFVFLTFNFLLHIFLFKYTLEIHTLNM